MEADGAAWPGLADEVGAHILHYRAMNAIDERERRALSALDAKRRGSGGRVVEFIIGSQHFDTQRTAIMDRHEADRMRLRRDFETLTERQGKTAQTAGDENGR